MEIMFTREAGGSPAAFPGGGICSVHCTWGNDLLLQRVPTVGKWTEGNQFRIWPFEGEKLISSKRKRFLLLPSAHFRRCFGKQHQTCLSMTQPPWSESMALMKTQQRLLHYAAHPLNVQKIASVCSILLGGWIIIEDGAEFWECVGAHNLDANKCKLFSDKRT